MTDEWLGSAKSDPIEEMMRQEILRLENAIKENQIAYRLLTKEYDDKRRAFQRWARPAIRPRQKIIIKERNLVGSRAKPEEYEAPVDTSEPQSTD